MMHVQGPSAGTNGRSDGSLVRRYPGRWRLSALRFALSVVLLAVAAPAAANVIHVPADQPTIQDAINAAFNGTEIIVAPDTYYEAISFYGKLITIRSSDGAATTIIDAQNTNRTVHMNSGELRASVLEGFTITGGGLNIAWAEPTIRNCVFSNNTRDNGPAIRIDSGSPLITDCTFTNNMAELDAGGAILLSGTGDPIIRGCTFTGNGAMNNGRGGAIHLNDADMMATIEDCTFTLNTATWDGGTLYIRNDNASVVRNCTFDQGDANWGGAVCISERALPRFEDCTFTNNTSTQYGGAVGLIGGSAPVFAGCRFEGNSSNSGGAFQVQSAGTGVTIEGCEFVDNSAAWDGGAINFAGQVTATISRSTFDGHFAPNAAGAIRCRDGADIEFVDCSFTDNNSVTGGAIQVCCSAALSVAGSTFAANMATNGGAIDGDGDSTTLVVDGSVFTANGAHNGAGIRLNYTRGSIIRNSRFDWNQARAGGAVGAWNAVDMLVAGCVITNNFGWDRAGGVYAVNTTGNSLIVNSTIADNESASDGVGINSTGTSTLAVANSILYGNQRHTGVPSQIAGDAAVTVSHSDVEGGHAGTNNIDADPLFADPDAGDFRLLAGSECIDAGLNADVPLTLVTDIEGNARILDGDADATADVDMGAYEVVDCNGNAIPDAVDIASEPTADVNMDGVPDECDADSFALNIDQGTLYPSIADAIDAARDGEEIVANPTAFAAASEIDLDGKALLLRSAGQIVQPVDALMQLADGAIIEAAATADLTLNGTLRTSVEGGSDLVAGSFLVEPTGLLAARPGSSLAVTTQAGSTLSGMFRMDPEANLSFDAAVTDNGESVLLAGAAMIVDGSWTHGGTFTALDASLLLRAASTSGTIRLSGVEFVADGFTVTSTGRVIAHGELYSDLDNSGEIVVTADTLIVGDLVNNVSGVITVQVGTTTLIGSLTNSGTITGDLQTKRETGEPRASGDGIAILGDYVAGAQSSLVMPDSVWTISVTGDYDNAVNNSSRFDMVQAELALVGTGQDQTLEVMSTDIGADPVGLHRAGPGHFPIGTLRVGPTATTVVLVDDRDNDNLGQADREALYVNDLIVESGATLVTDGHMVYYQSLTLDGGVDNTNNLVAVVAADPDINGDGQVDLVDYASLGDCLTGPGVGVAPACFAADLDLDDDIDLADFGRLQRSFGQ